MTQSIMTVLQVRFLKRCGRARFFQLIVIYKASISSSKSHNFGLGWLILQIWEESKSTQEKVGKRDKKRCFHQHYYMNCYVFIVIVWFSYFSLIFTTTFIGRGEFHQVRKRFTKFFEHCTTSSAKGKPSMYLQYEYASQSKGICIPIPWFLFQSTWPQHQQTIQRMELSTFD